MNQLQKIVVGAACRYRDNHGRLKPAIITEILEDGKVILQPEEAEKNALKRDPSLLFEPLP